MRYKPGTRHNRPTEKSNKMNASLRTWILGLVTLGAFNSTAAAQQPDILGIQPGMPLREAAAKLQSLFPKTQVQPHGTNLPTIDKPVALFLDAESSGPNQPTTKMSIFVTLPPNKQVVWMVMRQMNFGASPGVSKANMLDSLHEKFGKETASRTAGRMVHMWWLFHEDGQSTAPKISADELGTCQGSLGSYASTIAINGAPPANLMTQKSCFSSYYAVHILYASPINNPDIVDQYMMTAVNLPLASRSGGATVAWKNSIAEQARREETKKANQNKPVF
jgi:hypothetical protein